MWYNNLSIDMVGGEIMMKHAQSSGSQQTQNHKRSVHGWLMGEGWQVGEEYDTKASWILTATDKGQQKIVVLQPIDRADMIVIQAGVKTDDNFHHRLSEMNPHERNDFYFDLQYALLQMGVEYANMEDPFELVFVVQRIYSESLIRDTFIQRVMQIRNAQVMIILKIRSLLNEPPVALTEPPSMGFRTP